MGRNMGLAASAAIDDRHQRQLEGYGLEGCFVVSTSNGVVTISTTNARLEAFLRDLAKYDECLRVQMGDVRGTVSA